MPKFILAYYGGTRPKSPEEGQAMMAKWGAWVAAQGDALVEPQNPLGSRTTIGAGGTTDGAQNLPMGYSILEATDLDAALVVAKSCPTLEMETATIEVAQLMQMPG